MPYTVRPGDTLWALAQRFGVTVRELLAANPSIQGPEQLYPGQQIEIPSLDQPTNTFTYTVRPGDSFFGIAQQFRISEEALRAANPQVENPAAIQAGMVLYIPRRPAQQYVVQPGDSLWSVGQKFGVPVTELQRLNPGVDPNRLLVGQRLQIPMLTNQTIVVPRAGYGYDQMMADLNRLRERYPFIQVSNIGESVMGRSIPVVRIGTGPKEVHYNGSFHAEEWITTPLLMLFIERYADAFQKGERIGQFDMGDLYRQTSLWLVPMVNPDGVEVHHKGVEPGHPYYDLLLEATNRTLTFRNWAANIRGVDLNNQFPANWEQEKRTGPQGPAPRDYAGPAPLSEPESQAMADFTRDHDFRLVMAFHSQGEVVFWGYEGFEPPEAEQIVNVFAQASGYRPVRYAGSAAGYKDWFIQEWRRPGFTVEVGLGVNPLPIDQFWEIWGENLGIMLAGLAL
jgi:g-D-glutamyl-meso-diaminopimelate peptidase